MLYIWTTWPVTFLGGSGSRTFCKSVADAWSHLTVGITSDKWHRLLLGALIKNCSLERKLKITRWSLNNQISLLKTKSKRFKSSQSEQSGSRKGSMSLSFLENTHWRAVLVDTGRVTHFVVSWTLICAGPFSFRVEQIEQSESGSRILYCCIIDKTLIMCLSYL